MVSIEEMEIMVLVADLKTHGFGMGKHLRINAAQIRNAMRPVDGRTLSVSDGENLRAFAERLALRIKTRVAGQ